ncbi:MlaD family protein [Bacteroidales bacterium OttesenSCG-928-M11]|nr:MlaD family protein [Bacteroidales bacterium OttesenSCG-928-M11]
MKKIITKEVQIALIAIISLLIFYVGLNYLKGINLFRPSNNYFVLMPKVTDLQNSSPVYVDGFKVGVVNSIQYDFSNPSPEYVIVEISLDKKMKLQTGSYAELKSGLTTGAFLDIILNKYVSTYHNAGDTIEGKMNIGIMDKLTNETLPQLEAILPRLDSILYGVQVIVNHQAITQSLDHINNVVYNLEKSSAELNKMMGTGVPEIINNLNSVSTNFVTISENISAIDFQAMVQTVDQALVNIDQLTTQLNSPDNSLGLLLNDPNLYNHLDSTARNASELLRDLKENPKRYVHFSVF